MTRDCGRMFFFSLFFFILLFTFWIFIGNLSKSTTALWILRLLCAWRKSLRGISCCNYSAKPVVELNLAPISQNDNFFPYKQPHWRKPLEFLFFPASNEWFLKERLADLTTLYWAAHQFPLIFAELPPQAVNREQKSVKLIDMDWPRINLLSTESIGQCPTSAINSEQKCHPMFKAMCGQTHVRTHGQMGVLAL